MSKQLNVFPFLLFAFLGIFILSACNKDEMDDLTTTTQGLSKTNTTTDSEDHHMQDSTDQSEECFEDCEDFCFDFVYPLSILFPDGTTAQANSDEELEDLTIAFYEQNPNEEEDLSLVYPVNVVLEDGENKSIHNDEELFELIDACFDDEDWEEDCFEFVYPLTLVLPDATTISVNDDDELEDAVENWYEQNPDSEEDPSFVYPIEVSIEGEAASIAINSDEELEILVEECYGDDFEECFEIVFPINLILPGASPSPVNDLDELYAAVDAWYEANPNSSEDPTIEFPITVILEDGTEETINNEEELDDLFEDCYENDCEFNGSNVVVGLQGTATTEAVIKKLN